MSYLTQGTSPHTVWLHALDNLLLYVLVHFLLSLEAGGFSANCAESGPGDVCVDICAVFAELVAILTLHHFLRNIEAEIGRVKALP